MARRIKKKVEGVRGRNWIREGDTVQVMRGDDAGTRQSPRRGKVLRVLPQTAQIVVEGVNVVYRHVRKSQKHPRGGRIEKEAPIHISKVMLVDPATGAPVRRRVRVDEAGKRKRVNRDGKEIAHAGRG